MEAKECFSYRDDGNLIWLHRPDDHFVSPAAAKTWNTRYAGTVAGHKRSLDGRVMVWFNGKLRLAHRIIWEMHKGPIPDGILIDHEDMDKTNNRIENLRDCTVSENGANSKPRSHSGTGVKGVRKRKDCDRYEARIAINGWPESLGLFKTIEEAKAVYDAAAKERFGRFHRP